MVPDAHEGEPRGRAPTTWAFDVDGTLIGSVLGDRLRPGAVELLSGLTGRGLQCVSWSAGGADYAARKASEHGIDGWFVGFYTKAGRGSDGRYTTEHFHRDHRPDVYVDDGPTDIPLGPRVIAVAQFLGGNAADRALLDVLDALDVLDVLDAAT